MMIAYLLDRTSLSFHVSEARTSIHLRREVSFMAVCFLAVFSPDFPSLVQSSPLIGELMFKRRAWSVFRSYLYLYLSPHPLPSAACSLLGQGSGSLHLSGRHTGPPPYSVCNR